MTKIMAIALLTLALTACESGSENANKANNNKPTAATPAPATSAATSAPASPAASTQIKAGDKVKVTINGSSTEATVVSVDEKAGKVTVKMQGQKDEKTVAISAVARQ
ncbi:MAG: hypothetical protein ABR607_14350 [Pyrinomonadaceae bacterium]